MKDLRVTVTVKNGALLKAMEAAGYESAAAFHRASGVPYQTIINYLSLRLAPYDSTDAPRQSAETLSAMLGRELHEIFPAAFLRRCLETNRVTREVSSEELPALMGGADAPSLAYDPEQTMVVQEAVSELTAALSDLTPRERKCLAMVYGLDGHRAATLAEVAATEGVGVERIRQIVMKGQRKLAHPKRGLRARCSGLLDAPA